MWVFFRGGAVNLDHVSDIRCYHNTVQKTTSIDFTVTGPTALNGQGHNEKNIRTFKFRKDEHWNAYDACQAISNALEQGAHHLRIEEPSNE